MEILKCDDEKNISFWITFLMGVLVHLTSLSNIIFSADEYAKTILTWKDEISVGRLLLPFFQISTSTKYNVNAICGIIALIFFAATVELIFRVFMVRRIFSKVMIAAVLLTSPCAFSTMVYPSGSTSYFLAFFLAFLALYLLVNKKNTRCLSPETIISIVLIVVSMMIYQIYVTVVIVAFFATLLIDYLEKRQPIFIKKNIVNVCVFFIGIIVYFILYKMVFFVFKIEPDSYQGFSKVGPRMNLASFLHALGQTFVGFCDFWVGERVGFYSIINIVFLILLVCAIVEIILKSEDRIKLLLWTIVMLLAMLETSFLFYYTSSGVYYHNLMTWGCCIFYVFVIVMFEREMFFGGNLIIAVMLCICIYNYQNGNVGYYKLNIARQRTEYMVQTMIYNIDRIGDGTEKIAIVGDMKRFDEGTNIETNPRITGTEENNKITSPDRFASYTKVYYGRNFEVVENEELEAISKVVLSEKYKYKDIYPYGNYCFKYNDYIVLNFGE